VIGFRQIRNERAARQARDAKEQNGLRRRQAEQIAVWVVNEVVGEDQRPYQWIEIRNSSHQPIYQVIVGAAVVGQGGHVMGMAALSRIGIVPPGTAYTVVSSDYGGMSKRLGAEIGFHDVAGNVWIRSADGDLREIDVPIVKHYDIDLPTGWSGYYTELPDKNDGSSSKLNLRRKNLTMCGSVKRRKRR